MAARTISYRLIIEALLDLKLPVTIQATILISRHVYLPLLVKRCLLFFGALLARELHLRDLLLSSALSRLEFAI